MFKNRNVKRAIRSRQTNIVVIKTPVTHNDDTMLYEHGTPVNTLTKGCIQQLTKENTNYSDDLKLLAEGERAEAEAVLWTETAIKAGEQDGASISDKIKDLRTGRTFKVLLVRDKFYGSFYRAILGRVAE